MTPRRRRRWLHRRRHAAHDSTVFVGYPKTGNTWVRFLVGRYIQRACADQALPLFDSVDRHGDGKRGCIGTAIRFTHDPLRWDRQTARGLTRSNTVEIFAGKRVALLVRHPLDVLVSSWHQAVRQEGSFEGTLENFIADPVFGLDKLLRFYELWADTLPTDEVHLLRYEELRANTTASLSRLLPFLEIEPDPELVTDAVEYASFESMKRMETERRAPRYASSGLSVFATGDPDDPEAFHLRRGVIGGYRDYLTPEAAERHRETIAARIGDAYGYESGGGDAR